MSACLTFVLPILHLRKQELKPWIEFCVTIPGNFCSSSPTLWNLSQFFSSSIIPYSGSEQPRRIGDDLEQTSLQHVTDTLSLGLNRDSVRNVQIGRLAGFLHRSDSDVKLYSPKYLKASLHSSIVFLCNTQLMLGDGYFSVDCKPSYEH